MKEPVVQFGRWWWRALAFVALLAVLVGVPVAVVATVGVPGSGNHGWASLWSARRIGTDTVVHLGVMMFGLLWVWFAVTAMAEAVHLVAARRAGSPATPPPAPPDSPTAAVRALVRFIAVGSIAVGAASASPWPASAVRRADAGAGAGVVADVVAPVDERVSRAEERLRAAVAVAAPVPTPDTPSAVLAAAGLGSALVLATGALAAIDRRRRRQLRLAPNGARPVPTSIEQVRFEMQLRSAADARRLARIDHGLAGAATQSAVTNERPTVMLVNQRGEVTTVASASELPTCSTDAVMAHIGSTPDGDELFVDLEALGVLAVDSPNADDVVATIAASLSVSSSFVGHTMATAGLHTEALGGVEPTACRSLVDAVERSAAEATATGSSAVVVGRLAADDPMRPWLASVVGAGAGLGAVVAGDVPGAAAVIRATDDGHVLEPFGLDITPTSLTVDGRRALADLVAHADEPAEPHATVLPLSRASVGSVPASPEWTFLVRVFGRVAVCAADGSQVRFERAKALELVVWQAHHRSRPARSAARAALWDSDVSDATFANVVSGARRALDRAVAPGDAGHWLGRSTTDTLPLHDQVMSDADLLATAVESARSMPPREAIAVLRPCVELIDGMPFAGCSYLWPDAEGITSWLVLLATGAAADLAGHYLALGDVEGVFWATGRGLTVLTGHEELIALRMRAHARRGDLAGVRAEWDSHVRALAADSWASASPSPKLVALRAELLEGSAAM